MRSTPERLIALGLAALAFSACGGERAEVEAGGEVNPPGVAATTGDGTYPYQTWDGDRNRSLDENEFRNVARERGWSRWNTNNDAGIDENELGTGLFGGWDRDRNQQISETEWRENSARWYGTDGNAGDWNSWNTNGDGFLDQNEFRSGMQRTGFFGRWDSDRNATLNEDEFGRGVFGVWDGNRDRNIDANEWDLGAGGIDWF